MIPYLITAIALLVVLSPVAWMMPSPRQRREARLRECARRLGLEVRISELPQTRRQRVRREAPVQGVIYRLPLRKGWPHARAHLISRAVADTAWEMMEESPELSPALAQTLHRIAEQVPADVVAIELASGGPAFYWRERGDEQTVEQLHGLLTELAAAQVSAAQHFA